MARMKMEDGPLAGRVYMRPPGEPDYLAYDADGWRYFYARVPGPSPLHDEHGPVYSFRNVFSHPLGGVCALPPDGHAGPDGLFAPGAVPGVAAAPPEAGKPVGNMVAGTEQETGSEALARLRRQGAEEWRPGGGVGLGDVPGGRLQGEPGKGGGEGGKP